MSTVWNAQHEQYAQKDWIHKPSIFGEWAIQYFPPHGTLLDLGGGQGQDAQYFLEEGYNVTLLDFAESALTKARERMLLSYSEKLSIVHHDITEPFPFQKEKFDIIYSHLALHYFSKEKTHAIFKEIHQVLKPGGIVAFLVNSVTDPECKIGKKIEDDFYKINNITKRYFSIESIRSFLFQFQTLVADAHGETYKDREIGVHNLIRFVGKKN